MVHSFGAATADHVRQHAHRLDDTPAAFDPLLELVGDAPVVLLGEASHGSHELYRARAEITGRLIREKGFNAVAVEADWPDAARVNRYVRGHDGDRSAADALGDFERFPRWMWRNAVVLDFVGWLRGHNDRSADPRRRVGFYGLDLYSLYGSIDAVVAYLDRVDPDAAGRARARYGCLEQFGEDSQAYGRAAALGLAEPCEDEVVAQLVDLQRRALPVPTDAPGTSRPTPEADASSQERSAHDHFSAVQNARLAVNAEEYYRAMFRGRVSSWNLRDRHMAETLDELCAFLKQTYGQAKVVVWAHNSHLGDARATEMGQQGELNVGQLVRERYGPQAVLVGFTSHAGTVTAADDWGEPARRKRVRPSLEGSYERLFHETGLDRFYLRLRDADPDLLDELRRPRLERAIGVIYRPETERRSHYFYAHLPDQFDAVLHYDEADAVEPLDRATGWDEADAPETFPSAL
jgi:erythromycin esterase-like protein